MPLTSGRDRGFEFCWYIPEIFSSLATSYYVYRLDIIPASEKLNFPQAVYRTQNFESRTRSQYEHGAAREWRRSRQQAGTATGDRESVPVDSHGRVLRLPLSHARARDGVSQRATSPQRRHLALPCNPRSLTHARPRWLRILAAARARRSSSLQVPCVCVALAPARLQADLACLHWTARSNSVVVLL